MASAKKGEECRIPPQLRIQPGETRNPNGKPPSMNKELKEAFRDHTMDALETLVEIMLDKRARNFDRVRAAECILDRGWGRPNQQVEVDVLHNVPIVFNEILKNEIDNQARASIKHTDKE